MPGEKVSAMCLQTLALPGKQHECDKMTLRYTTSNVGVEAILENRRRVINEFYTN